MKWAVVCQVGKSDDFMPELGDGTPRIEVSFDNPGATNRMRHNLDRVFGELKRHPGDTAQDLLHLAMAVLAADLYVPRKQTDDSWTRDIEVYLPVAEVDAWTKGLPTLEDALAFLSGDRWAISLRKRTPEDREVPEVGKEEAADAVCLFSGGLDSCIGAVDLLAEGKRLALVSHYGAGATHPFQDDVFNELSKSYPGQANGCFCHVEPPRIEGVDREITRRARSFLFIGLAVAVADAIGATTPVYVCENGLISLNVPLTGPRAGSWSTRTTHPHFMTLMRKTLAALGLNHDLILPYRFKTKGEMLRDTADPDLVERITRKTMSCAHPESLRWVKASPNSHCGYCFPCIIRRAATHAAGTTDAAYAFDVVTEDFDRRAEKARDGRAVRIAVERMKAKDKSDALFDVLDSGPLPPEDAPAYADVYRRGMEELSLLFEGDA